MRSLAEVVERLPRDRLDDRAEHDEVEVAVDGRAGPARARALERSTRSITSSRPARRREPRARRSCCSRSSSELVERAPGLQAGGVRQQVAQRHALLLALARTTGRTFATGVVEVQRALGDEHGRAPWSSRSAWSATPGRRSSRAPSGSARGAPRRGRARRAYSSSSPSRGMRASTTAPGISACSIALSIARSTRASLRRISSTSRRTPLHPALEDPKLAPIAVERSARTRAARRSSRRTWPNGKPADDRDAERRDRLLRRPRSRRRLRVALGSSQLDELPEARRRPARASFPAARSCWSMRSIAVGLLADVLEQQDRAVGVDLPRRAEARRRRA